MKEYLVDVPVMINVWARPLIQEQTFAPVKEARPSKLYLISDGPRSEEERTKLEESRAIVENIDWDCEVHKLYMDSNQGMYKMLKKQYDFVFSQEDRCIILEDDVLVSVSFIRLCAELLEKYKDDTRITAINGTNHRGHWRNEEADYFFTRGNAILGYATWKRSYNLHYHDEVFYDDTLSKEMQRYVKFSKNDFIMKSVLKAYNAYKVNPNAYGHPAAIEFYRSFINFTQSQMDIVVSANMVTNIGSEAGTHTLSYKLMPRREQAYFYRERYELEGDIIRHPRYVIRDFAYEEWFKTSKMDEFFMTIERGFKYLRYLPFSEVCKKVKSHYQKKKRIEK